MKPLLFMSLRSPFARRVRLLLEELGLEYDTQVVDVFNPTAELFDANPLGRVPALRLPNGEMLIDSWVIVDYLRARHSSHPLFLEGGVEARARAASGVAVGVMESCVAAFLERMRPPGIAMEAVRAEHHDVVARGLRHLEGIIRGSSGAFAFGDHLLSCDLDIGAAVGYSDLRLGPAVADRFPALRAYFARLSERPAFRKTVPPA